MEGTISLTRSLDSEFDAFPEMIRIQWNIWIGIEYIEGDGKILINADGNIVIQQLLNSNNRMGCLYNSKMR